MTNVQCSKCGEWCVIDDTDFWQGDLEDFADDNLIFRFTDYCEGVIDLDGDDWETCGQAIEVLRYATVLEHRDIEQEDCE
jgi:hypothetical protein